MEGDDQAQAGDGQENEGKANAGPAQDNVEQTQYLRPLKPLECTLKRKHKLKNNGKKIHNCT